MLVAIYIVLSGVYGAALGFVGIHFNNPTYWVLLALFHGVYIVGFLKGYQSS